MGSTYPDSRTTRCRKTPRGASWRCPRCPPDSRNRAEECNLACSRRPPRKSARRCFGRFSRPGPPHPPRYRPIRPRNGSMTTAPCTRVLSTMHEQTSSNAASRTSSIFPSSHSSLASTSSNARTSEDVEGDIERGRARATIHEQTEHGDRSFACESLHHAAGTPGTCPGTFGWRGAGKSRRWSALFLLARRLGALAEPSHPNSLALRQRIDVESIGQADD